MEQAFIESVSQWNKTAKVTWFCMMIDYKPVAVRVANALRNIGHEVNLKAMDYMGYQSYQLTIKRLPFTDGK